MILKNQIIGQKIKACYQTPYKECEESDYADVARWFNFDDIRGWSYCSLFLELYSGLLIELESTFMEVISILPANIKPAEFYPMQTFGSPPPRSVNCKDEIIIDVLINENPLDKGIFLLLSNNRFLKNCSLEGGNSLRLESLNNWKLKGKSYFNE